MGIIVYYSNLKQKLFKEAILWLPFMESTNNSEQKDKPFLVVKPAIKTPLILLESSLIALFLNIPFLIFISTILMSFGFGSLFFTLIAFKLTANPNNLNPVEFIKAGIILQKLVFTPLGLVVTFIIFTFIVYQIIKAVLKKTEYRFYKDRVEYYHGFLVRSRKTLSYDKISNLGVREGIIERMFGLGTIFIDTAGYSRTGYELAMHNLENPNQIYEQLSKLITKK